MNTRPLKIAHTISKARPPQDRRTVRIVRSTSISMFKPSRPTNSGDGHPPSTHWGIVKSRKNITRCVVRTPTKRLRVLAGHRLKDGERFPWVALACSAVAVLPFSYRREPSKTLFLRENSLSPMFRAGPCHASDVPGRGSGLPARPAHPPEGTKSREGGN